MPSKREESPDVPDKPQHGGENGHLATCVMSAVSLLCTMVAAVRLPDHHRQHTVQRDAGDESDQVNQRDVLTWRHAGRLQWELRTDSGGRTKS